MLKTRIVTALVLLAVLLTVLFSENFYLFSLVLTVFFGLAAWEGFRLFGGQHQTVRAAMWTIVFAITVFWQYPAQMTLLYALCAGIWAIRLAPSLQLGLPPVASVANGLLGITYTVTVFGCFVAIAALFEKGAVYLLSVLAIVWIADIGAYFAGKAFGRRKLAPSISPGKSWEGAFGGWLVVLASAAATATPEALSGTFAAQLLQKWGWPGLLGVMTALVAASIVGDLFESQLKRRISMKDSSNLLPGHGGVLDRVDALIPVLPLAVLFDSWL